MQTTIEFLPAELLALIFEQCFLDFESDERSHPKIPNLAYPPWHFISDGLSPSFQTTSHMDKLEHFKSPSRFPYALAAVSPIWMAVLSTQPEYWKQIVICYDSRLPKFWDMGLILSWSCDLPIDVIILRQNLDENTYWDDLFNEPSHINTLMDHLKPHLPRCRSLYIETHFRSSIPLMIQHIHSLSTPKLSSLSMTCESRDTDRNKGFEALNLGCEWYDPNVMIMPELRSLVVEGKNLGDIYPLWLPMQANLEQLVICDYPYSRGNATLAQFLRIIQNLPNLLRLKLQNVRFSFDPEPPLSVLQMNIQDLHLEAIQAHIIREIFERCYFNELEYLHLSRCSIKHVPQCDMLILEDINNGQNVPLGVMLEDWRGSSLWIDNYRGFNDSFFDTLRSINVGNDFGCPWMERLSLSNLPSFSLKRLKKMIKRRNEHYGGPPITALSIKHCAVAELTPQDIEWFTMYCAGGFSYVK